MPSSLLPSRSARNSESISPSNLFFVSSSCSRAVARNFFRSAVSGFFAIEFTTPGILSGRACDRCMQIVAECLVDSRADELACLRIAREKHRAVDFRRLSRRSAAQPRRASRHRAFDQHLDFASYEAAVFRQRYFRLRRHQAGAPRTFDALGHLVRQIECGGIFFARICENAHAIELLIANKIRQAIEGLVSLAGK